MTDVWRVFKLVLVGATIIFGTVTFRAWRTAKANAVIAQLALARELAVNDSTKARLTVAEVAKDSLGALLDAARELNGRLIAGVRVHVPQRDTLVVHDTLATTLVDSTRVAQVLDSTFAGVLKGTITARPCCAPLSFEYTLTRPAFDPEIGFVRVGDSTVAVVSWRGEEFRVTAPYMAKVSRPFLQAYGEGLYTGGTFEVRAGGEIRTPFDNVVAVAGVQQDLTIGSKMRTQIGARIWFRL